MPVSRKTQVSINTVKRRMSINKLPWDAGSLNRRSDDSRKDGGKTEEWVLRIQSGSECENRAIPSETKCGFESCRSYSRDSRKDGAKIF